MGNDCCRASKRTGMGLSAEAKHLVHVVGFISWLLLFEIISGGIRWRPSDEQEIDPVAR